VINIFLTNPFSTAQMTEKKLSILLPINHKNLNIGHNFRTLWWSKRYRCCHSFT